MAKLSKEEVQRIKRTANAQFPSRVSTRLERNALWDEKHGCGGYRLRSLRARAITAIKRSWLLQIEILNMQIAHYQTRLEGLPHMPSDPEIVAKRRADLHNLIACATRKVEGREAKLVKASELIMSL